MKRFAVLLMALLLIFGLVGAAFAAEKPMITKGIIVNPHPPRFSASIWTDKNEYRVGDPVRISFRSDVDGYVVIYDNTPDGRSNIIWPRNGGDGWVKAGRTYNLPDGNYAFNATEPAGTETLVMVVSRNRAALSLEWNMKLPITEGLTAKLQSAPAETWASASCTFTILPRYTNPEIRITGTPGARIFIDGKDYGTAPLTANVEPGRHQIVGLLPGMQVELKDVRVKPNQGSQEVWFRFSPIR